MKHTYMMEIDAPPQKVFELIENPELNKLWMEGLEDTTFTSDNAGSTTVGTAFKQRIREGARLVEYEGVVTAYHKPEHLALQVGDANFTTHVEYRLTPLDHGTRLEYTAEGTVHTWYGQVMEALYSWFTKRIVDRHMTKLKQLAEDPATTVPAH